jgi:hypothetical protein
MRKSAFWAAFFSSYNVQSLKEYFGKNASQNLTSGSFDSLYNVHFAGKKKALNGGL